VTAIAIILAVFGLLALALRYGVDSRFDRPGRQL
jgi:hypothetical protein